MLEADDEVFEGLVLVRLLCESELEPGLLLALPIALKCRHWRACACVCGEKFPWCDQRSACREDVESVCWSEGRR